jgi:hypothetical protein
MRILFVFLLPVLWVACSKFTQLEQAITLAGDNRFELGKVLHHYSQSPVDSLEYRVAVFLIENMPYSNMQNILKAQIITGNLTQLLQSRSLNQSQMDPLVGRIRAAIADKPETSNL